MKVKLGYKTDQEYFAINDSDNRIEIDMLPREDKKAMSPTELLLSGVIACAAVDIVSMIKKKRKSLIEFSGEASGERRDEQPRKFTSMHIHYRIISPDLTQIDAEKIVHLAVEKYCSVASTINESTTLTHSVEVVPN
ncbi:MAG: putative redox protein [Cyclobacteriaceae bacterium]|jgi:putative redox protein